MPFKSRSAASIHTGNYHTARAAKSRRHRASLLDELESRILLSATASPFFVLQTISGTDTPMQFTSAVGMSPSQMRTAYGLSSITGDGTGQTIAIVDAYNDPNVTKDLATFDNNYKLSAASLTVINENGGTTLPGTDPAGRGDSWAVEISLDVQWAHVIAPGASLILVEATSSSTADLDKAVLTARSLPNVSVVSMSWGSTEAAGETSTDADFTTPSNHINVTFVASSGDNGAYSSGTSVKNVSYPAVSPNVVAIGGTTLTTGTGGTYTSETGWGFGTSSAANGGSGGGISLYEAQPSDQKGIVTQSTTKRTVPDVSMDADPNSGVAVVDSWDSPSSQWMLIGGTSLAAPMWAGIIAVADQARITEGAPTLTTAQTLALLYTAPTSDFHDITSGNNGYAAGPGYDLVTGRGSPVANTMIPYLTSTQGITFFSPVIGSFKLSAATVSQGASITLTASSVTETSGTVTGVSFYLESNGTTGLQLPGGGTGDTLLGIGAKSGTTWTLTADTDGLSAGTHTYYAIATDAAGRQSVVASATLTILVPTIGTFTVSPVSINPGTPVKLTAANVAESGGSINKVFFYMESNGTTGLQTATDTLLAAVGTHSGTSWTFSAATTALVPGTYTYYAFATDAAGAQSVIASATLTVTSLVVTNLANDNFANATPISGKSVSLTGTNVGATKQPGEPNIAGVAGGASVWYAWTAPASGKVSLNTKGSNFDTLLGVYTGTSVSTLTVIATNDDDSADVLKTSALTFSAVSGTTYYFSVDGYRGASGTIDLNLSEA